MNILILIFTSLAVGRVECQCTFPADFTGTWVSSSDGTWTVSSTEIFNYKAVSSTTGNTVSPSISLLNFTCHENQGTIYTLESNPVQLFPPDYINLYTCLDLTDISASKLIYYKVTKADTSGYKFTINSTFAGICNDASYNQPYRHRVALKSGSESDGTITCPSSLFGKYNYNTCTDAASTNTSLDVCDTRTQFMYNYTMCNTTQMFSVEGTLNCVHFNSSDSTTYLTLYNADSVTPDETSYYRYTCLALQESDGTVTLTANPEKCIDNQNSSSIASPGYAVQLTPFYLCPITNETSSSFDILPIILGIIGGLLLLAIIIGIIICCCLRKRRKKRKSDEESPIDEPDSESQHSTNSSRRSLQSSDSEDDKSSLDSGIGEPPVTARTDTKSDCQDDLDDDNHDKELVINSDGDKDIDDKTSRPRSGQRSRMSDLPPSTLPPDDDQQTVQTTEEDEQIDDKDPNNERDGEIPDVEPEKDSEDDPDENMDEESDGQPESEEETENKTVQEMESEDETETVDDNHPEAESEPGSEPESDPQSESEPDNDTEPKPVQLPVVKEEESEKDDEEHQNEEKDKHEDDDENEKDNEEKKRIDIEDKPDEEDQNRESGDEDDRKDDSPEDKTHEKEKVEDEHVSTDEDERNFKRIGGKKGKGFAPTGALTTVLVTRDEDERKRMKVRGKSKKQRMKKLASKIYRKYGKKGRKNGVVGVEQEDDLEFPGGEMTSDDERKYMNEGDAPFMEQYRTKKRIEHILDEQHYWSDPEDKESFGVYDTMSSVFNSDHSSCSESEYEDVIGPDGAVVRVKKTKKKRRDFRNSDSETESEYQRKWKMKRAGSLDSMVSVEDPGNMDNRNSKRKLNEHMLKESNSKEFNGVNGINGENVITGESEPNDANENDLEKSDKFKRVNRDKNDSKTKLIQVRERSNKDDGLTRDDIYNDSRGSDTRNVRRKLYHPDALSDFCDTDIDKLSDRDSGMDDEDEAVDVILNSQQQELIVNMLFDEDMNLRPQFDRDENGRIVRRLDSSVIYDPHTGRFTFRKRLGQLFKVPRLKRNDTGRPTGGYIEDEYGPKMVEKSRSSGSSKKARSHSSRSGRGLSGRALTTAASVAPSMDLKRTRGDGKNVGFDVPNDDVESIPDDELDYHKRGRRDVGSALRRTLNKRLFRRKKHPGTPGTPGYLPEIQLRRTYTGDMLEPHFSGTESVVGAAGVSPLMNRASRAGGLYTGTPGQQRRTPGGNDPDQWQRYREGLQSDRKILDKLSGGRPFEPRESFVELEGESTTDPKLMEDEDNMVNDANAKRPHMHRGFTWMNDDGRLVIRERNCPELHQQKPTPLFTIIRRPGDLEKEEREQKIDTTRNVKSAPLQIQDYNADQSWHDQGRRYIYTSENSIGGSLDGSQMTSIDDNRLRRLLEELYRDKKYLDRYVETTEPKSEAIIHSKGLAEHGRGYLLERADYWERRGPLPPRPPMTEVGWRMKRQKTMWESRQTSDRGSTMITMTPDINNTIPGVIESPRENGNDNPDKENVYLKENRESSA